MEAQAQKILTLSLMTSLLVGITQIGVLSSPLMKNREDIKLKLLPMISNIKSASNVMPSLNFSAMEPSKFSSEKAMILISILVSLIYLKRITLINTPHGNILNDSSKKVMLKKLQELS